MTPELVAFMAGTLVLRALAEPDTLAMHPLPTAKYVSGTSPAPIKKDETTLGVVVSASAAVVMDAGSGEILYEKDPDEPLPLASLTKLVAAMTYLDLKPDLDKPVILNQADNGIGREIVPLDETFTGRDVLQALLVGSANEAANAIARTQGGKQAFVEAMNKKAKAIGMERTVFFDPSGEDLRNRGTARDVATALRAAMAYPEIAAAASKPQISVKGVKKAYLVKSTNLLIGSDLNRGSYKVVAAKTGTLPEAGYCFAQATRDNQGHTIISVVLGGETHYSRFQDVKAMTYWAFRSYAWPSRN
jgi:D-alanyl-D-alanine endopeptidase (penicillin-binding protein 7)